MAELWVSTYQGGLILLDPRTGSKRIFVNRPDDPRSISDNSLTHLMIDATGISGSPARTRGLNLLKKGASAFIRYQHVQGDSTTLPTNRVWRPYQDRRGRIWVLLAGRWRGVVPDRQGKREGLPRAL